MLVCFIVQILQKPAIQLYAEDDREASWGGGGRGGGGRGVGGGGGLGTDERSGHVEKIHDKWRQGKDFTGWQIQLKTKQWQVGYRCMYMPCHSATTMLHRKIMTRIYRKQFTSKSCSLKHIPFYWFFVKYAAQTSHLTALWKPGTFIW